MNKVLNTVAASAIALYMTEVYCKQKLIMALKS